VGDVFSLAAADEAGTVRGVAMVGRPVARMLCDGWTLEVTRCCSALYGAAWRATRALITYTLASESGTLRASGWRLIGETCPRVDKGRAAMGGA
jgi:hypothetical protein